MDGARYSKFSGRARRRGALVVACAAMLCLRGNRGSTLPLDEHALPPASSGDGVYGRFSGDLDFGVGVGLQGTRHHQLAQFHGSVHYLSLSGLRLGYADGFDTSRQPSRVLDLVAEIKPLFLPRWVSGMEQGPSTLDLMIDSVCLGAGPYWELGDDEPSGRRRGLQARLGVSIPLVGSAAGPWVELGLLSRWPELEAQHWLGSVTLSWHTLVNSGLTR